MSWDRPPQADSPGYSTSIAESGVTGGSIEQMDRTRSLAASSAFDPDQDGADTLMYKHTSRGTKLVDGKVNYDQRLN